MSITSNVKMFSDNENEAGRYRGLILCNPCQRGLNYRRQGEQAGSSVRTGI